MRQPKTKNKSAINIQRSSLSYINKRFNIKEYKEKVMVIFKAILRQRTPKHTQIHTRQHKAIKPPKKTTKTQRKETNI